MVKKIELVDKYKFVKAAIDTDFERFVLYITLLEALKLNTGVYFLRIFLLALLK